MFLYLLLGCQINSKKIIYYAYHNLKTNHKLANNNNYALRIACKYGQVGLALQLLKNDEVISLISINNSQALCNAIKSSKPHMEKLAQKLFKHYEFQYNVFQITPEVLLNQAIKYNKRNLALNLLDFKVYWDGVKLTSTIKYAFDKKLIDIVKYAFDKKLIDIVEKIIDIAVLQEYYLDQKIHAFLFLFNYSFIHNPIIFYKLLNLRWPMPRYWEQSHMEHLKDNILKQMNSIPYPNARWKLLTMASEFYTLNKYSHYNLKEENGELSVENYCTNAELNMHAKAYVLLNFYITDKILRDKLSVSRNDPAISSLILSFHSIKLVEERRIRDSDIKNEFSLIKYELLNLPKLFNNPNKFLNNNLIFQRK